MDIIKKYTAIEIGETKTDDVVSPKLVYGRKEFHDSYVPTEFDTEEEAIAYAQKVNSWGKWLIVPIIRFNNFPE